MEPRDRDRAAELLEHWARASEVPPPRLPTRRTGAGLGPLVALAVLLIAGAVGLRAWQEAGGEPTGGPSATASASGAPSSILPSTTPSGGSSPTPSPSPSPSVDDAKTARAVATRYESARASGDWPTAWSMLSDYSKSTIGSLARYEQIEQAYNASGGSTFEIGDPTQDPDLLDPSFLGDAYLDARATADIRRAWLVFVAHPEVRGASAGAVGLLIAPIGDRWYVWIAH